MPKQSIDINDPTTYVECPICHGKFRTIQQSHTRRHGLTIKEFAKKFPKVKLASEVLRKNASYQMSNPILKGYLEELGRSLGKSNRGRKFTKKHKEAISRSIKKKAKEK